MLLVPGNTAILGYIYNYSPLCTLLAFKYNYVLKPLVIPSDPWGFKQTYKHHYPYFSENVKKQKTT